MGKEMAKELINMKMGTDLLENGKTISNLLEIIVLLMEMNFKESSNKINSNLAY